VISLYAPNGVDQYRNGKIMDKRSPSEYTCVKVIKDFSKKVCINLVSLLDFVGITKFKVICR